MSTGQQRVAFVLAMLFCMAGRLHAQQAPPLAVVFSYQDSDSLPAPYRRVAACLQRVVAQGLGGHSGGYRPGVDVQRRGDTLEVQIVSYPVAAFNAKYWRSGEWQLVVGNLAPGPYVIVWRTMPGDPKIEHLLVPGDEDGSSPLCRYR